MWEADGRPLASGLRDPRWGRIGEGELRLRSQRGRDEGRRLWANEEEGLGGRREGRPDEEEGEIGRSLARALGGVGRTRRPEGGHFLGGEKA